MSLVTFALIHLGQSGDDAPAVAARRIATAIALLSSFAVIGLSFVSPANALYAYLMNVLSRPAAHWLGRTKG
ncbi:hypothetical protein DFR50_1671 [Roseiarcus fermentans]|uniref:Uncharacterized protein n=1 Tax=Roseiarcus fermentans TaxID=1473586 RepID=A0A366EH76_9HYPH|nr:hypothetical protein [Roseiarcus fermentans]RBP00789.1 hypothetical protein DFR50_1671 [Roseiarcus fermentans]